MDSAQLRQVTAGILWLGGGPDAGKTTVARILVRRYGLGFYSLDKRGRAHLERLASDKVTYRSVLAASPAGRLVELDPAGHASWTWTFARDRFPLLLEDLAHFKGPRPVLVEGVALLPELVKPLLPRRRQAIWLIPSGAFIQANWTRSKKRFLARQTADLARAKSDLIAIDLLLAERLAAEAQDQGLRVIEIDGSRSPVEVAEQVIRHFEPFLPPAAGPAASS